jgi:hypothetical protein
MARQQEAVLVEQTHRLHALQTQQQTLEQQLHRNVMTPQQQAFMKRELELVQSGLAKQ